MAEFFEDIFKYRPRKENKNIGTFLGNLKTHPEVIAKRLTEIEKDELREDMAEFFEDIFKYRPRKEN